MQPEGGKAAARLRFPGSARVYQEFPRPSFRPDRADFNAGALEFEVNVEAEDQTPLDAVLFFKDKDGLWFQSTSTFRITPGAPRVLRVPLDQRGRNWRGVGHNALYDARFAARMFDVGVSFYSNAGRSLRVTLSPPRRTGERRQAPLAVEEWSLPAEGEVNRRVESRFNLSREFFNPFDPEEIKVDFELTAPDGRVEVWPAFFSAEYTRSRHFTREKLTPSGIGFWELRFTPQEPGEYRVRLLVEDGRTKEKLATEPRILSAAPSLLPGPVRISRRNFNYFELATGEFFYPVGLNIHTNTDRRSEIGFDLGHLPDRGTYDYEEYFEACGKNGINAVEVWMAGWTMALEHSAARPGYYGVGIYNLEAAWKLDFLIELARRNGIRLNLVIDNHGRLSNFSDPEWQDNPLNSTSEFAVANGGFLDSPVPFFKDAAARKNNSKRARYLAARWGSSPEIMAVELWSEVDLVEGFRQNYDEGVMGRWTGEAAEEWSRMSQLKLPVTTHVCGTYQHVLNNIALFEPASVTHIAGDAYRDPRVHFADHLRSYGSEMSDLAKPRLITEYGGRPDGGGHRNQVGDVHTGLWGSLFAGVAGTPFLWWHDFVHQENLYPHYLGFSKYLAGIDLRQPVPRPLGVKLEHPKSELAYDGMALTQGSALYGWIFCRPATLTYPSEPGEMPPPMEKLAVLFDGEVLGPGIYRLRWYDTMSGEPVAGSNMTVAGGEKTIRLEAPPFRIDLAFKCERIGQ